MQINLWKPVDAFGALLSRLKGYSLKGTFFSCMRAFSLHFTKEWKQRPYTRGWEKRHSRGGLNLCAFTVRGGSLAKLVKHLQNVHASDPGIYRTSELAIQIFISVLFIIVKVGNNLLFNSKGLVKLMREHPLYCVLRYRRSVCNDTGKLWLISWECSIWYNYGFVWKLHWKVTARTYMNMVTVVFMDDEVDNKGLIFLPFWKCLQ